MCLFICSDETLYGKLIEGLKEVAYMGRNEFPETKMCL